jgi:hypothetical protein|tara:strand:- start:903 stop:1106 length:204 start_codon:yes stop_codon:yes gene_type:complete
MHIRREIDHILDDIIKIIAENKSLNKRSSDDLVLKHLIETINLKTKNGKRAKGIWTNSPEFLTKSSF